jgi:hypothetical protein
VKEGIMTTSNNNHDSLFGAESIGAVRTAVPFSAAKNSFASKPRARRVASDGHAMLGVRARMLMCKLIYGLGTAGTNIASRISALVKREFGRIPSSCNWLGIDGATRDPSVDSHHFIGLDVDGSGTRWYEGYRRFLDSYSQIRYVVDQQIQNLSEYDPIVSVEKSPRDVLDVSIFAGCGGSSTGMLQPMISLVHDVAQNRRIKELRLYLVLMGADMPLRDSSRILVREQTLVIPDNCANTLMKIYADITTPGTLEETRPDGSTFTVRSCDRVWAPAVIDQSNGQYEWSNTKDLVEMISWAYFLQTFTEAGKYIEDRDKDNRKLGVPAHNTSDT